MSKKKNEGSQLAAAAAELPMVMTPNKIHGGHQGPTHQSASSNPPSGGSSGKPATPTPHGPLQVRLGAGRFAVKAAEVEIRVDGARLTGGNGIVEFDIYVETWVDIVVIRGPDAG